MTSGYMRLPPELQPPLEYPTYLMYPAAAQHEANAQTHDYCTLRKSQLTSRLKFEGGSAGMDSETADGDSSAMVSAGSCSRLLEQPPVREDDIGGGGDLNSPRELLLQMSLRDKHRAGFMYGTLRHPQRHNHQLPPPLFSGSSQLPSGTVNPCRANSEEMGGGGGVVPPPPMFEEGGLAARSMTGGTLKKCAGGKPEKKDKMESRV